jgi:acetoin utilization deacetylase AcuC-like enzyme
MFDLQDGLWPRTGKLTNTGEGDGQGFTINIPLPGLSGWSTLLLFIAGFPFVLKMPCEQADCGASSQ